MVDFRMPSHIYLRGHVCTDDVLEDYCDSPKAKHHPLFSKQNMFYKLSTSWRFAILLDLFEKAQAWFVIFCVQVAKSFAYIHIKYFV